MISVSEIALNEVIDSAQKKWDEFSDRDFQGKVLLRLAISTQKMTGGTVGPCGYLNYLKNNIYSPDIRPDGHCVIEWKDGRKKAVIVRDEGSELPEV